MFYIKEYWCGKKFFSTPLKMSPRRNSKNIAIIYPTDLYCCWTIETGLYNITSDINPYLWALCYAGLYYAGLYSIVNTDGLPSYSYSHKHNANRYYVLLCIISQSIFAHVTQNVMKGIQYAENRQYVSI